MKVCPNDQTPVVSTFEQPGAEWHCLRCGGWFPLFCVDDAFIDNAPLHQHVTDLFRSGVRGPTVIEFTPPPIVESANNIRCNGCGADSGRTPEQGKPSVWYERTDKDGTQYACSRRCIDAVAAATGKTRAVMPW